MRNNRQIIVYVGPSGSGKTTKAEKFIHDNPTYVRVNRDSIRLMLVGSLVDYYKRPNLNILEKRVSFIQHESIRTLLLNGNDIIVDNTHLKISYINELVQAFNHLADITIKEFDEKNYWLLRERVSKRDGIDENSLSYINRQIVDFNNLEIPQLYYPKIEPVIQNSSLQKCVIVDIDGTLAKAVDRSPYDYTQVYNDAVIYPVRHIVNQSCHDIILFSGRDSSCRKETTDWLNDNDIIYDHLFMRKSGDTRRDSIIKEELYNEHIRNKYYVEFVVDDRLRVIEECWEKLGFFVINVNQGNKRF